MFSRRHFGANDIAQFVMEAKGGAISFEYCTFHADALIRCMEYKDQVHGYHHIKLDECLFYGDPSRFLDMFNCSRWPPGQPPTLVIAACSIQPGYTWFEFWQAARTKFHLIQFLHTDDVYNDLASINFQDEDMGPSIIRSLYFRNCTFEYNPLFEAADITFIPSLELHACVIGDALLPLSAQDVIIRKCKGNLEVLGRSLGRMVQMKSVAFDDQNNLHRVLPGLHGLETLERFTCYSPFQHTDFTALGNFIQSRNHPLVVGLTHLDYCDGLRIFLKSIQFYPVRFVRPSDRNHVLGWYKPMNDRIQANLGFLQVLKGLPERLPEEEKKKIYLASVGPWPDHIL